MRRIAALLPVIALLALVLGACSSSDDSTPAGFADTLPLDPDQPTFVAFYAEN